MSQSETIWTVVQCDDAAITYPEDMDGKPTLLSLRSVGTERDIGIELHALYRVVMNHVGDRHIDLIRLAAFVFRADQAVSRGGDLDADARRWKRRFHLCIPVAEPDFWNQPAIVEGLVSALSYLTDDGWSFSFRYQAPAVLSSGIQLSMEAMEEHREPGAVVLFSGGLDSLCTVVQAALNGERPIAISQWADPRLRPRQAALIGAWNQHYPGFPIPLVGASIDRKGADARERTQRSRGFLYGCLASVLAAETGAPRVYLADNGPISLNLPINDQLVGAMASRATHPQFLWRFNQVINQIVPSPLIVANPLQWKTRAEALDILKSAKVESLVAQTISCSAGSRLPSATPQCGGCSQCVDRRFATLAAGLEEFDPVNRYRQDVFLDVLEPWERTLTAHSYVRFAQAWGKKTDQELLLTYPHLVDIVLPGDPAPNQTIQQALDLMHRHTGTVMRIVEEQIVLNANLVARAKLRAGSLLGKVVGEQAGRRAPQSTLQITVSQTQEQVRVIERKEQPATTGPVMEWIGAAWRIEYEGTVSSLGKSIDLARLAVLLREPNRSFSPEAIIASVEGQASTEPPPPDMFDQGFGFGSSPQPIFDHAAARKIKQEIRRLGRRADQLLAAGDRELAKETMEQIQEIQRFSQPVTGLGGQSRTFNDDGRRRHDMIRRSLQRAIDRIGDVHRPLHRHLVQTMHLSTPFVYAPEPPLVWRVVLPPLAA